MQNMWKSYIKDIAPTYIIFTKSDWQLYFHQHQQQIKTQAYAHSSNTSP